MDYKNLINNHNVKVTWEKCPHGVLKSDISSCPKCDKIEKALSESKTKILKEIVEENKSRIPIRRGCSAAAHGGCFCTGQCQEIIGWVEPNK